MVSSPEGKVSQRLSLLVAPGARNPSWLWHGISKMTDLIAKGLSFAVENGRKIIWNDPWVPQLPSFKPRGKP